MKTRKMKSRKMKSRKMKTSKMKSRKMKTSKMKTSKMKSRKMKFKRGGTDPPSTPSNELEKGPNGTPIDPWIKKPLSKRKDSNCGPNGTHLDTHGKACKNKEDAEKRRAIRSRGITKKTRRKFSFQEN